MLPHLSKFKLDIVSNALNLPDFNHHRAGDDAKTCGLIMDRLMTKMEEELDGDTYHCPIPDGCKPRAIGMKM